MIRSLQQIIESEESPTGEEWARLQRCVDAWHEARVDRAAEYVQQERWSGYGLTMMLTSARPTALDVRGWYHQLRDSEGFEPGAMAKILCDLIRFAD